MYYIVAVDLPTQEVCNIALRSLLCSIATFEFDSITTNCKITLVCTSFYMSYLVEGLEPFQYFSDPGPYPTFPSLSQIPKGWEGAPNLLLEHINIWSAALFKTQLLPIESKFRASSEAKDLFYSKKHTQDLASTLRESLFTPAFYCFNTFRLLF